MTAFATKFEADALETSSEVDGVAAIMVLIAARARFTWYSFQITEARGYQCRVWQVYDECDVSFNQANRFSLPHFV